MKKKITKYNLDCCHSGALIRQIESAQRRISETDNQEIIKKNLNHIDEIILKLENSYRISEEKKEVPKDTPIIIKVKDRVFLIKNR